MQALFCQTKGNFFLNSSDLPLHLFTSPVDKEKFFVCAQCPLNGAYDAETHEVRLGRRIWQGVLSNASICDPLFFSLNYQVVICENHIGGVWNAKYVITHELIHAFDNCRAKVDFTNARHLACTEVCVDWKLNEVHCPSMRVFKLPDSLSIFFSLISFHFVLFRSAHPV